MLTLGEAGGGLYGTLYDLCNFSAKVIPEQKVCSNEKK